MFKNWHFVRWGFVRKPEPPANTPCVLPSQRQLDARVDLYSRALEQCTSGLDKQNELKRNLDFYRDLAEARRKYEE